MQQNIPLLGIYFKWVVLRISSKNTEPHVCGPGEDTAGAANMCGVVFLLTPVMAGMRRGM